MMHVDRGLGVGIAIAVGVSLLGLACTGRGTAAPARVGCDEYLTCLAEADPERFEEELATYGTEGTCFDNSDAANCETACRELLDDVNSTAEACNPPNPDEPGPSASGAVDCADAQPGPTVGPGAAGPTGFPETFCNPRSSGEGGYKCCSDDPAAEAGGLPEYRDKGVDGGIPYFSGVNNALGTSGMCVNTNDVPPGSGLVDNGAANCPIPCNPTWERASIDAVCGASRVCCQTRQLQAKDCVQDPESGEFRPVSGNDIGPTTNWNPAVHATHQDPGGTACAETAVAAGADPNSVQTHVVFRDCIAQLTVANQRGFCMSLGQGQACPTKQEGYVTACEAL